MAASGTYRTPGFVLLLILALAAALRFVGLNQPLWYDEILMVDTHLRLPWSQMLDTYSLNHHYLYDLQAKLSVALLGETPAAARLPAALFGVGVVWAAWMLARDILGTRLAHLSALLVAISYHQIWFSQNARGYTEMAFWATLGTWLFLRGMRQPSTGTWIGYALTLALAVFTHLTGAFVFLAHGLVWLGFLATTGMAGRLTRPQIIWPAAGFALGGVLTLLLYAPLLPTLLSTIGGVSGTSSVDVMTEYQNPIWTVIEGARTAIGAGGLLAAIVVVGALTLVIIGGFFTHRKVSLFAPIVAVHIAVTLVLLSALGMRIWPRFFFADIALILILIVAAVQQVCLWFGQIVRRDDLGRMAFNVSAVLMILLSVAMAYRNYTGPKQNLQGAITLVDEVRGEDEPVFAVGQASRVFAGYFATDWVPVMTSEDYADAAAQGTPQLFVVAFPARTFRVLPDFDADAESMELVKRFPGTLGDGAVLVFRRN